MLSMRMFIVWSLVLLMGFIETPAPTESEFVTAKEWLNSWQSNDSWLLVTKTTLPFTFATTNRVKSCEGIKQTPTALEKWRRCMRRSEKLLAEELNADSDGIRQDDMKVESEELKALVKRVPLNGKWIGAYLNGNGVTYSFRFLITTTKTGTSKVRAFLFDTYFDQG